MKISNKQNQEIEWITKHFCDAGYIPSEEEKQEYINVSVHGKGSGKVGIGGTENKLLLGKRRLDMNIKMWRKDIADGLFFVGEWEEEGMMEGYGDKIFKSIMDNLPEGNGEGPFRTYSLLWSIARWNKEYTI